MDACPGGSMYYLFWFRALKACSVLRPSDPSDSSEMSESPGTGTSTTTPYFLHDIKLLKQTRALFGNLSNEHGRHVSLVTLLVYYVRMRDTTHLCALI